MQEEQFIISMVAIVFGTGLVVFILGNIFSIIKTWIKKGDSSSEMNPDFLKALSEFKKNTERRITNLEAIISDLEEEKILISNKESENKNISIPREQKKESASSIEKEPKNLKNMLR